MREMNGENITQEQQKQKEEAKKKAEEHVRQLKVGSNQRLKLTVMILRNGVIWKLTKQTRQS